MEVFRKEILSVAAFLSIMCFLLIGEVIEWIFFFWFDDMTVHTMKVHGFWWGGVSALIVFVGYLIIIYDSRMKKS